MLTSKLGERLSLAAASGEQEPTRANGHFSHHTWQRLDQLRFVPLHPSWSRTGALTRLFVLSLGISPLTARGPG